MPRVGWDDLCDILGTSHLALTISLRPIYSLRYDAPRTFAGRAGRLTGGIGTNGSLRGSIGGNDSYMDVYGMQRASPVSWN